MRKIRPHLTYANVVATLGLFIALGGASAFAAVQLGKNTVGSRQLKAKSVTTGKVALNAINGSRVANGTLTGEDIKLSALGTVPSATTAANAGNALTVGGHAAACPQGTTLIQGTCFDSNANPVVGSVEEAADACAAKDGYLPSPLQLYSVRTTLNLGTGIGTDHQYTGEIYANTAGGSYSTVVVDGTGAITEQSINSPSRYTCAYSLMR